MKILNTGDDHVTIQIESAKFNNRGWFEGGMYVYFAFDQNKTEARWMYFDHSCDRIGGLIGTWDRILTEEECLQFCEENYG